MTINNQNVVIVLFLIILSAFLRYPFIDLGSIWLDEAWRIQYSQVPLDSYSFFSAHKILSYEGFLRFIGKFIGTDAWSYRIASNLTGILSVPALFYLGLIISNNRNLSLIASTLLALNPWHIAYSVEAAPYSIGSFLVVMLFINLLRLHVTNKNIYFLFSLLISVLLSLLHLYLFGLALLILFISLFLDWRKKSFRKKIILLMIILICLNFFQLYYYYIAFVNSGTGTTYVAGTTYKISYWWFQEFPRLFFNSLLSGPDYDRFAPTASKAILVYKESLFIMICSVFIIFSISLYKEWNNYNKKIKYVAFTIFLYILFIYLQPLFAKYGSYLRYLIPIVPILILIITLTIGLGFNKNRNFLKVLLCLIILNYLIVIKLDTPWTKNNLEWKNLYKELSSKCQNKPTFFIIPNIFEQTIAKYYLNNTACKIIEQPAFNKHFIEDDITIIKQSIKDKKNEDIFLSNKIKELLKGNKNTTIYIVAWRQRESIDNILNHNKFKAKTIDGLPIPNLIVKVISNE